MNTEIYNVTAEIYNVTAEIYNVTVEIYNVTAEIYVAYLWRREDNPMCGEEGFMIQPVRLNGNRRSK